jgi:hypothetical protein
VIGGGKAEEGRKPKAGISRPPTADECLLFINPGGDNAYPWRSPHGAPHTPGDVRVESPWHERSRILSYPDRDAGVVTGPVSTVAGPAVADLSWSSGNSIDGWR